MSRREILHFQKILVFDTTGRDQTEVALIVNKKIKKISESVRAQDLQKLTNKFLKSSKLGLKQIDVFAVLTGPGSYTGTRMGVTAVNTLGWLLDKPIIELEGDSLEFALEFLKRKLPKPVPQATVRY